MAWNVFVLGYTNIVTYNFTIHQDDNTIDYMFICQMGFNERWLQGDAGIAFPMKIAFPR